MSKKILDNENYMNDIFSYTISNNFQAIKRREERNFWGPVDIPTGDKRQFTVYEPCPTMTFNSDAVHIKNESPAKEKENGLDYLAKDLPKTSKQRFVTNLKNLEAAKRKKNNERNNISDEDDKKIPIPYANYQQYNKTDTASGSQTVENININISSCQKMDISLSNNLPNSRPFSGVMNLEDEENYISVKETFIENINFNDVELEAVSNEVENVTKNIHKNVSPINSNKKLGYDTDAKVDVKDKFDNWCENRRKDYRSRSSLNLSDGFIPTTAIQKDPSNRKPTITKNEPVVNFFNQSLSENVNYSVNRMFRSTTNLSERKNSCKMEKSIKDFEQVPINANSETKKEETEYTKFNSTYQKVAKDNLISENKPLFSLEIFQDKQNTLSSNEQHYIHSSSKVLEKVLKVSPKGTAFTDKILEQTKSSKSSEFIIDEHGRNKVKKLHNQEKAHNSKHKHNRSYELPPRFQNHEVRENSFNPEKQLVPKIVHSKNNSFDDGSKQKTFRKKKENIIHNSSDCLFSARKNRCLSVKEKQCFNQLCIKISDKKSDKDFEFMADSVAISRIKKVFPKLSADIPDVDSGCKEMCYSADAMNIILRFVLCGSYKIVMPSPVTGVEVLAAAKLWNINNHRKLFDQTDFIEHILTPKNAGLVFSHAYHYDLQELCDACKDISPNNAVFNTTAPRKKQKMCHVSISTYMEPFEINIPFEPVETDISLSFKKQIHNKFTFKAISGCYSIIGFHIQLNEEHVVTRVDIGDCKSMLEIDYSVKNVNDNEKFEGREEKPLRPINIIYFKEKLVIKPNETGEIVIETEIEPYLCSGYKEKEVKVQNSLGELDLRMESNMKIKNSDRKLFLIGKFFYHVTEIPQN